MSEIPDPVKEIGVFTWQPCYGVYKRLTRIPKTAASIRRRALAILMWGPRGFASYHRKYFTDADRCELRVSAVIDAFGGSLEEASSPVIRRCIAVVADNMKTGWKSILVEQRRVKFTFSVLLHKLVVVTECFESLSKKMVFYLLN